MARFFLTALLGFAACQQGWAGCDDDDEMDLCEDAAPSPMSSCGDDPELDLCADDGDDAGEVSSPMPKPMPKPMPTPMPKPTPMPASSMSDCDADEVDLCDEDDDDKSPMPTPASSMSDCDADEVDLCDEDDDDKSPMPMPTPKPTPMPTPEPTPSQSPTTAASVQVTSFDTELELGDVTKFDTNKFKEAMALASSVSADKIEIGKVEYKTKVSYSMAETVTEAAAKTAIASSCGVPESRVEVTIASRRLSESRRLATSIDAIISTQTASEVSSITTKAADAANLKQAFTAGGLTVTPTVATEPKNSVVVHTILKGEAGAAAPEVPPAGTIQSQVGDKLGTTVVASTSTVVEESQTNTPVPTPTPTAPTPTPGSSENAADDAKGQTPSALLACATATLVAVLCDAA